MIIIENLEQGSKEWHDARMMKITGTKLKSVMGTSEARRALIAELIAEEGTEQSKQMSPTKEMERGTDEEVFARKAFSERTGKRIENVGMCVSTKYPWVALSPDGLIRDAEGKYSEAIEGKAPDSKKAILYRIENMIPMEETGLLNAKGLPLSSAPFLGIPSEYKWQCVLYFIVNEDLKKLHFNIFDARFIDEAMQLYTVELHRDNEVLQEAMKEAEEALVSFRADWLKWKEIVLPTSF